MTILDANMKLYEWFTDHDSVVIDRDFQQIILISDNSEEDKACFIAALKDLESAGMIARQTISETEYWILKRPYTSYDQDIKVSAHIAKAIAEEINTFCDTIDDPTDKCDAGNLGEKDVMNLLLMYQHSKNALQNQLTANDEDDTLL
tara:strand:+ start:25553 stop:25993 length:441 start_codon:yes stop_codon:yes gene_type:complete